MSETIINPYQVGKLYTVPVVILKHFEDRYNGFQSIVPVLGEPHEDQELINVADDHYHVDWRFVNDSVFSHYRGIFVEGMEFGTVIWENDIQGVSTRRLKCKREFSNYPHNRPKWMGQLKQKYSAAIAKKGRCPHKGFDMTTLKPDAEGCVTCPLHGLRWNIQTWKQEPKTFNL